MEEFITLLYNRNICEPEYNPSYYTGKQFSYECASNHCDNGTNLVYIISPTSQSICTEGCEDCEEYDDIYWSYRLRPRIFDGYCEECKSDDEFCKNDFIRRLRKISWMKDVLEEIGEISETK